MSVNLKFKKPTIKNYYLYRFPETDSVPVLKAYAKKHNGTMPNGI
jgi:hypothetical protein